MRGASAAIVLVGAALALPAAVAHAENGSSTPLGIALLAMGTMFVVFGLASYIVWPRRSRDAMPPSVRGAVMGTVIVLAFCALELSDRLVRQEGRILYWTTFLLPALAVLLFGLLAGQRWAWWAWRALAAAGALWFLVFTAMIPFASLHGAGGVATPWYGRLYMMAVSIAFAALSAVVFRSLGRSEARAHFGLAMRRR